MIIFFFFSQISDLGNLQDVGDIDPSNLESLAVEAFERRIKNLDRENTELKRKLQGIYCQDLFVFRHFGEGSLVQWTHCDLDCDFKENNRQKA